jgi:hypothetical protein
VVPAFEMEDFSRGIPETKEELLEFVRDDRTRQVHKDKWSPAHGPTNYDLWYKTDELYDITYGEGFEPYIIGRTDMPL